MSAIPISSEAEWLQHRKRHIGGSEVAALFGEHPYLTKFELWHRKNGTLPDPDLSDNERVFWGNTLEPAIAMGVARVHGWNIRKVRRYLTHPRVEGFGGSLDYEVVAHDRGAGVLEIKCADWLIVRNWEGGEPPLSYELQVQSYLAITGRAWGAMAVLVGGNDLRVFEYERRPKTIALIEGAVGEFWQSIRDGKPPRPNFIADGNAIAQLYSAVTPGRVVDMSGSNRLPELVTEYKRAAAMEKEGATGKAAAKAEILEIIGDAETVICGLAKISSKQVAGGHVEYEQKPYRSFSIHLKKESA